MSCKKPTVFISYNQESGDAIADQLQNRLEKIADVIRDKISIPDWGSIKDFMKSIRRQDLVIMIITAKYLTSPACMFEVVEAMKDENWNEHTMFVVADDATDIYTPSNWLYYFKYWEKEEYALNDTIESVGDPAKSIKLAEKLRNIKEIELSLIDFLSHIADAKNPNINEAVEKIYQRVNKTLLKTENLKEIPDYGYTDEQSDPETLFCLGRYYDVGEGKKKNYKKAAYYYKQAAKLGHIRAQCCLGVMYKEGLGIKISNEKAMYWFQEAANQGDACGQYLLGNEILRQNKEIEVKSLKAIEWYQKAAKQGYIPAQSALGKMYASGRGVKQDYEKASYWFQKRYHLTRQAAEQGDSDAQFRLGLMYKVGGIGLKRNVCLAAEWCQKAARQGHSDAQTFLGKLYLRGEGVNQNYNEAVKWYEKACAQGNINALLCLGDMYAKGEGVEKNYLNAKKHYNAAKELIVKAAGLGAVWAQNLLAHFYESGRIEETDYDKAIYWYEKAAAQDSVSAMQSLCRIYKSNGKNNYEMVMKWNQQAISLGSDSAMMNLANMHKRGLGVEQSYDMAIFWYQQAAERGNPVALMTLGTILEEGIGAEPNIKKAIALYTNYAYRGSNYARWRLGYLHEHGLGAAQNDGEAANWYRKAAEHGYMRAQRSLAYMYVNGKGVCKNIEKAINWYQKAANGVYDL